MLERLYCEVGNIDAACICQIQMMMNQMMIAVRVRLMLLAMADGVVMDPTELNLGEFLCYRGASTA